MLLTFGILATPPHLRGSKPYGSSACSADFSATSGFKIFFTTRAHGFFASFPSSPPSKWKRAGRILMIARIWRGTVREADKDIYYEYLQKTGLKEYAETPGNRGVHTMRRIADGKCEFF